MAGWRSVADLITHMGAGLIVALGLPRRWAVPVAVGCALPDLVSRLPGMVVARIPGLPEVAQYPWGAFHTPVAVLPLAVLSALCFQERDRWVVFGGVGLGGALHFGLDVLQDHHGVGYHLCFPVHYGDWELGWIGSEATTAIAPWIGVAAVVGWGIRLAWEAHTGSDEDPSHT